MTVGRKVSESMLEKPLNILIVEDDAAHLALLVRYLRKGLPTPGIRMATTLAEAREAVAEQCPDLALVDLNLPDGAGTELLAERIVLGLFPVVIMTSQGDEARAVAAIKSGATDYIVKNEAVLTDIAHVVERAMRDWQNLCARQQAEDELRRSEAKYRRLTHEFQTLLEGISDAIALVDPQHRVVWANRVALENSAVSRDWQSGIHCFTLWNQRSEACPDCPVVQAFQTGLPAEAIKELPNGRIWGKRSFPLKGQDGNVANVIILATDITEKLQLRAESMRSSQLAALGELAAGVAHEINNPMNAIINYAQLLLDDGLEGEKAEFAGRIIDGGERVAEIVRNLLTFSRKPQENPLPVSLLDVLQSVLRLSEVRFRHEGIILDIDVAHDLPQVTGQYQQLQQVLMNLVTNACQALNQKYPGNDPGKRMVIELKRHTDDGVCWVRTSITDYGVGIPANLIEKVCDPFFTTKPQGVGTGLGMSISHGIVTSHNGRLLLSSAPGEWTRVIVDLPCLEERE